MASSPGEYGVERRNGIGRAGHGYSVEWFHQTRRGSKKRGVDSAAGCRDDLATTAEDGLLGQGDVGKFESGVTNG